MEVKIDYYKSRQISIIFFGIQNPKSAMKVKIYLYQSRQISRFFFDIQNPKSAMEVKIDSNKSRQISSFSFDIQNTKSAMEVKIDSYESRQISIYFFFIYKTPDMQWKSRQVQTSQGRSITSFLYTNQQICNGSQNRFIQVKINQYRSVSEHGSLKVTTRGAFCDIVPISFLPHSPERDRDGEKETILIKFNHKRFKTQFPFFVKAFQSIEYVQSTFNTLISLSSCTIRQHSITELGDSLSIISLHVFIISKQQIKLTKKKSPNCVVKDAS